MPFDKPENEGDTEQMMGRRIQNIQQQMRRSGNGLGRRIVMSVCLIGLISGMLPTSVLADESTGSTGVLTCTLTEGEGHRHTDACYTMHRGALICTDTSPDHVHTDECYLWSATLTCGMIEGEGAHTHTESCYSPVAAPIGSGDNEGETFSILEPGELEALREAQEAVSPTQPDISMGIVPTVPAAGSGTLQDQPTVLDQHQKTRPLGFTEPVLIGAGTPQAAFRLPEGYGAPGAGWVAPWEEETEKPHGPTSTLPEQMMLVFAEHADPYADVETEDDWDAMFANLKLTGNWAKDLIMVAESQLGYTESTLNYAIASDQTIKGYTRYGAWYGIPYGDWCAMFISFCLHYAQIPWSAFPYSCHCVVWTNELDALGLFHRVDDEEDQYQPKPGDLIFFDYDLDGRADHAGIISGFNFENGTFYTIEGNRFDYVERFEILFNDYSIMGFGELPKNPREGLVQLSGQGTGGTAGTAAGGNAAAGTTGSSAPTGTVNTAGTGAVSETASKDTYYPTLPDNRRTTSTPSAETVQTAAETTDTPETEAAPAARPCVLEEVIRVKTTQIVPLVEQSLVQVLG